jgi:hypothetical protein
MSEGPDSPRHTHEYWSSRAARRRRLRRRRLIALGVAVLAVPALVAGAWLVVNRGLWDSASEALSSLSRGALSSSGAAASPEAQVSSAPAAVSPSVSATPVAGAPPSSSPSVSASPSPVIEIGWVGDTTPGSKYGLPPDDGRALFAAVRGELRAPDLMIANLEGTYSTAGPSKCDEDDSEYCYAFQAPPAYSQALRWAGIDLVSLANNHSHDYLQRGLEQTEAALRTAGIRFTGLTGQVAVVKVKGVRVAAVGFAPYGWSANLNDLSAARDLVRRAARKADVVIVLMHAGAEGAEKIHTPDGPEVAFGELRGDARAFAHTAIDAGADLVLGSGPHVIRGIERYRNRLIAYSLGDFGGWGTFGLGGNLSLSGLLTVRVNSDGGIVGGRWLSLTLVSPGVPRVDRTHAAARLVRQLSAADFRRTYRLDGDGVFSGE